MILNKPIKRNRSLYLILIIIVIVLGLISRSSLLLPSFISKYAGDTLYALMLYFGLGFIQPKDSILKVSLLALTLSYLIEISQLYQSAWINLVRDNRFGGLILGHGFLWSDIVCYTVGVLIGLTLELVFFKGIEAREAKRKESHLPKY